MCFFVYPGFLICILAAQTTVISKYLTLFQSNIIKVISKGDTQVSLKCVTYQDVRIYF